MICWEIILALLAIPIENFFYRLFGLRKMCEDTFWDFSPDCSLIPSSMKCDSCGGNMHIVLHTSAVLDGRVWHCGNGGCLNHCRASKSVRHNSYFTGGHLRIPTILLMTYEIFQGSMLEPNFFLWVLAFLKKKF